MVVVRLIVVGMEVLDHLQRSQVVQEEQAQVVVVVQQVTQMDNQVQEVLE